VLPFVAGAVGLLLSDTAQAGPITIDDYSQQNPVLSSSTINSTSATVNAILSDGILGQQRHVEITLTAGNTVNHSSAPGLSRFSCQATSGGNIRYVYDGTGGAAGDDAFDPVGLGGVDLTDAGKDDALRIQLDDIGRQALLTITVHTDGSNASSFGLSLSANSSQTSFVIPFDNFTPETGTGADFTNVGAIEVELNLSQGDVANFDFSTFETATTMTATMTDQLSNDVGNDSAANPGDTITYTAVVTNTDDDANQDLSSVLFSLTPDANSSLVVGTVTSDVGTVTTGNTAGDTTVVADMPTLSDGAVATITFDVLINDPLPVGAPTMSAQGAVTTAVLTDLPTDDPEDATSSTDPTVTTLVYCGSGVIDAGEVCDDAGESATCDIDCTDVVCGDGTTNVSAGEECDAAGESTTCDADCTEASCGDGTLNTTAGETCDDAGESATCDTDCTAAECGDGTVNATAGEACDDAGESETCNADCSESSCGDGTVNATAGESCDDAGESETCDADCTEASCGDGTVNATAGEACDDSGESATCNADCSEAACGDGIVNATAGETCDDGNTDDGDGCDSTCQEEVGTTEETGTDTGTDTGTGDETGDTGDTGDTTDGGSTDDGGDDSTTGVVTAGGSEAGDSSGCDCRADRPGPLRGSLALLFGLIAWRRRRD
jgi:cysteine-rich repeat protein